MIGMERRVRRERRHRRIRKTVVGTTARPRISVYASLRQISAQVIDDGRGETLAAASSLLPELRGKLTHGGNVEAARHVGKLLAARARKAGVTKAVLDRGGHLYHGRIKALADALREAGLEL